MANIVSERRINQRKIEDQHGRIKENIRDSYEYFRKNYENFNFFRRFVFESSLLPEDISVLAALGKPQLEFNILESRISRLRGEFAKQEPNLYINSRYDAHQIDPQLLEVLNDHIRALIFDSNTDNLEYDIFTDVLSGGFSAIKVYTDYIHERSFDQEIYIRKCFDPTLVGFDKTARLSHKGDGNYAFEIFPYSKERFIDEYGNDLVSKMKFIKRGNNLDGFSWSYRTAQDAVILVADYYEKKRKKTKIVQLVDGQIMTVQEYEQFLEQWNSNPGMIAQAPTVKGKSRETDFTTIVRHRVVENSTVEYVETDFKYLPIIFIDGNSANLRSEGMGSSYQLTRPYVYHAKGIQKLKNFAGCTLANELENMLQHKLMAPKEGIPEEYKDAYINQQKASILIYNSFKDDDPTVPLAPQAIPRVPCPPEVAGTFSMSDEITQAILGDYEGAMVNSDYRRSGVAIENGDIRSNSSSMPYIIGYIKAWNQLGKIILDLIPKYYTTQKTIPVRNSRGQKGWVMINQNGNPTFQYDSSALELTIEAGVNFEVQKQRNLSALEGLMKSSPIMQEFMGSTEEGIELMLNNIDLKGMDGLKQKVGSFIQKMDQQKQAAMQEAKMNNPLIVKQMELKQQQEAKMMDMQLGAAKIAVSKQDSDTKRMDVLGKLGIETDKMELQADKVDAENARTAVEGIVSLADHEHGKAMELLHLHHENERHKTKNE